MPFLIRSQSARKRNRGAWQQVGLVAGFLAGRHFVGTEDLHYGYWADGIEPLIRNLPLAQAEYCRFLLEHIPVDAHRILDVGCGAGNVASQLVARGHEVDCVSPSGFLNSQAKARLQGRARIFECKYEEYSTTDVYDAVLFCESFQYVRMDLALENISMQLRKGGQLIICDFFRQAHDDGSRISGGHHFYEFEKIVAGYPLRLMEDIDITARAAPTFTVIDSAFSQVLQPIWKEVDAAAVTTHPWISKFVNCLFRHKIEKVKRKYFTHERSAENFEKFKTYRLLRYERC